MLHFGWYCILGTLIMRCGRRDTVQQEAYKKQESITGLQFLTELPNFVLVLASAVVSHSLIVWLDFVDTLGNLLSEAIVTAQSRRMSRDLRYEYNYGVGKIEALTTFFTDAIELGGLLCIAVVSVMQLISPESPSELLIYVVALKVVNVFFDLWFLRGQAKIRAANPSTIAESEYVGNIGALAFDGAALLALLAVWLLRGHRASWYVSPILSLVIALVMMAFCVKHIRRAITELADKTLPEEAQLKILKVLNRHNGDYRRFDSIRSRYTGTTVTVDLAVTFDEGTTYRQIEDFRDAVQRELTEEIPNCRVSVIV